MYTIRRECWNEKTFNGYTDNPYWRIGWAGYEIGLKDSGEYWMIYNDQEAVERLPHPEIQTALYNIVEECKIQIFKIQRLKKSYEQ